MNERDIKDIFFNRVPLKIIKTIGRIGEASISELSRKVETSYAHAVKIIKIFEENMVVKTEMKGRERLVRLTERGKDLFEAISRMEEILTPEYEARRKIKRLENEIERIQNSGEISIFRLIPIRYEIENLMKDGFREAELIGEKLRSIWERVMDEQM